MATVLRSQPPTTKTALLGFDLGPIGQLYWARLALGGALELLLHQAGAGLSALPFLQCPYQNRSELHTHIKHLANGLRLLQGVRNWSQIQNWLSGTPETHYAW